MLQLTTATVTLKGTAPYSQSRKHEEPRLPSEAGNAGADAYDIRTWRKKLNTRVIGGRETVVIPPHGMHQAIIAAAKYSKKQIPGQGKATWTAKFTSGIMMPDAPSLGVGPEAATMVAINANSDGVRGSGSRVTRRFPHINDWTSTFDIIILDPIINQEIFSEVMELAGLFIGIGQFRPEKGGHNGRFNMAKLVWRDAHQMAA